MKTYKEMKEMNVENLKPKQRKRARTDMAGDMYSRGISFKSIAETLGNLEAQ